MAAAGVRLMFARKRLWLLIFLAWLAGCAPEPEPTPEPRPTPEPLADGRYESHMPVVAGFGDCPKISDKAGIALAGARSDSRPPKLPPPLGWLCIEELVFHRWLCDPLDLGQPVVNGVEIPMVWSDEKNGYDYRDCFRRFMAKSEQRGDPYEGRVMWGNEPDRPDQAAMSIEETAQLFCDVAEICPLCDLIGPGYSSADDGSDVRLVWDEVEGRCPERMGQWYGDNPHHFPIPELWTPGHRIEVFCERVYGGECERPIYMTMGWRTCYGSPLQVFRSWSHEAVNHPDVELVFFFTTYQEREVGCQFDWMAEWRPSTSSGGEWVGLRPLGVAFLEGVKE